VIINYPNAFMNIQRLALATVIGASLIANVASAQVATTSTTTATTISNAQLSILFVPSATVQRGTQNVVATIMLSDKGSSGAIVRSLPIMYSGASGYLQNCSLRTLGALTTPLNTGANAIATLMGPSTAITMDTPLMVAAGSSATVTLVCDVSATTPIGTTFTLGITPASVAATDAVTAAAIIPTAAVNSAGSQLPTSGLVSVTALAPGSTGTTGTPNLPNTGAGGNATANIAVLLAAALAALIGSDYLLRRRRR
jgi:hypothetical protein